MRATSFTSSMLIAAIALLWGCDKKSDDGDKAAIPGRKTVRFYVKAARALLEHVVEPPVISPLHQPRKIHGVTGIKLLRTLLELGFVEHHPLRADPLYSVAAEKILPCEDALLPEFSLRLFADAVKMGERVSYHNGNRDAPVRIIPFLAGRHNFAHILRQSFVKPHSSPSPSSPPLTGGGHLPTLSPRGRWRG